VETVEEIARKVVKRDESLAHKHGPRNEEESGGTKIADLNDVIGEGGERGA
jgi:hypothetical protein